MYRDHGPLSDPRAVAYARGPAVTVTPTASIAGQFLHNCQQNLDTARVALDRIPYAAARAQAFDATQDDLQGLVDACRDVEMSLAAAIAKLTVRA